MTKTIKAFDKQKIHAGNKGLTIDHDAVAQATDALMKDMTLVQKVNEIRGLQMQPIDGFYHAGGDESLGIPTYKMVDGPRGARSGKATAFPVAIARAATFDVELERRVGLAVGKEVAAKGGNVLLAPTINLLRHPGWGRAQETYSEDPHHMGAMGAAFISGAQNYVLTSPKHFAANNLEITRFEMTADMDTRTMHEVYLPHFKRCVKESAAASVMSAYNKVNGTYCGQHAELLTKILRDDWGFKGFVESDWFLGTRSTAPSLNAGMNIEMPAPYRYQDEKLESALADGELTEETIHNNARAAIYQKIAWQLDNPAKPAESVVECDAHIALAREVATKSIVLLKNEAGILPLEDKAGLRIAVVGDLADTANLGDRGSSMVTSTAVSKPLGGLQAAAKNSTIEYFKSDDDFAALKDFDVSLVVAGLTYIEEGEYIPNAQQEAEGGTLARGGDRASLALPEHQRDLVKSAIQHSNKSIVLLEGGSAIEVREWVDDADGLLMVWYPGCEGGHAIADVVFGKANPSGKLPASIPKSMDQLMPWDVNALVVEHDLLHGYRYLDHHQNAPEYPFGFGLSYTSFELSNLRVERQVDTFKLVVSVINTGERSGATVAQLYVSCLDSKVFRVPKEMKGFGRAEMTEGETVDIEFELADEDLHYFDMDSDGWQLESCRYQFKFGLSSQELPLMSEWQFAEGRWNHLQ
ncbi:MAG: glycoside hydrolase family 3 C-terminal domain-containing protein [Pseudomonadota bacterium]